MDHITEPIDVVKLCLDQMVYVKMKGDRSLKGKLHVSPLLSLVRHLINI